MSVEDFGTEQTTDEDRAYSGSRFSEVRDAIFANPYQRVWGREGEPALPVYPVTLGGVLSTLLSVRLSVFSDPSLVVVIALRPGFAISVPPAVSRPSLTISRRLSFALTISRRFRCAVFANSARQSAIF